MNNGYPFSAIVGQELLKKSLLLAAVDPSIGGVLIRGDKGTAKSTAARGLSELLPAIELTAGCPFNCKPEEPLPCCEKCSDGTASPISSCVPFINLPLGATEDRVLGTLDFERALKEGRQRFQPGLLAAAHRGILYIDEVNLLADHLVDVLLDVAAMGINTVQREGLSVVHPARVTLIGTMNPEEGDLRPQLLDRFGMMVDVTAPNEPVERALVVRNRLHFESDPEKFRATWKAEQLRQRDTLAQALIALPSVTIDDELISLISSLCCQFHIVSLRADIVMTKVVRALAALEGRKRPDCEDVKLAARLVLAHRKRVNPLDKTGLDEDLLKKALEDSSLSQRSRTSQSQPEVQRQIVPDPEADMDPKMQMGIGMDKVSQPAPSQEKPAAAPPVFAASDDFGFSARLQLDNANSLPNGLRGRMSDGSRGRYLRAVKDDKPSSLAVDATIRHAVIHSDGEQFNVHPDDLHGKVRLEQKASLVILLVDASGSMAAMRRMEAVKGTVMALLQDSYRKRDQVCVISFRGDQAALLLPPTRSVQLASRSMQQLPTGGRTPLAHGLSMAAEVAAETRDKARLSPLLVVLTDGKGNVSLPLHENAQVSTMFAAKQIQERKLAALVIDTEDGFVRAGLAHQLAQAMGAEYLCLDKVSSETVTMTVRSRLRSEVR